MSSIAIDRRDGLSSSTAIKGPVRVATTQNILLTGLQTVDEVVLAVDDRVLVKNQTAASENGIYVVDTGPWRRSADFKSNRDVVHGTMIIVTDGTLNSGEWYVETGDPINVGATDIAFSRVLTFGLAPGEVMAAIVFETKAQADVNLNYPAITAAWVVGDANPANNGIYQKQGMSGSGWWLRLGDFPRSWSPLYRNVSDGARRVQEIYDWVDGWGAKPPTGYVGPSGLTSNIAEATDIRGPIGLDYPGTGDMLQATYDPTGAGVSYLSALGQTLSSQRIYGRVNDHVNILDYATSVTARDAIKSGATAINSVWDDASTDAIARGISTIFIPDGNYEIENDQHLINSGLVVRGAGRGTRIKKNGLGEIFTTQQASPVIASGAALVANAGPGTAYLKSVQLDTGLGASFTVGMSCLLADEQAISAAASDKQAQMLTVQAVAGDLVTFWETIRYPFSVASSAKLVPNFTQLAGVGYRDLRLVMDDTITLASSLTYNPNFAIDLQFCQRVPIENIEITNAVNAMIQIRGCRGVIMRGIQGYDGGSATSGSDDPDSTEGTGGFSYGVAVAGLNQGILVEGGYFERCRHAVTTTGFYSSIFNYGEPVGLTVSSTRAVGMKNAAFDTHQAGRDITYIGASATDGHFVGFQIRSFQTRLIGCSATNMPGAAAWIRGSQATGTAADRCHISDFTAIRTNLSSDILGMDFTQSGAIMDEGLDTFVEGLRTIECAGPAITLGRNGIGRRTVYRDIDATDMCQSTTNPYIIHVVDTNFTENVWIDGLNSTSTDGKVADLVKVDSADPVVHLRNVDGVGQTGQRITTISLLNVDDRDVTVNPYRVSLDDDFLGNALSEVWRTAKGSDAAAALPAIFTKDGGAVRLVTGANAAGDMTTNGSQLCSSLNWRATGAAIFECRVQMSAITNVAVFVGLTDQLGALEMPFTLGAGNVLTSNASDAVGVLFDTGADTDNWWLVGVKADVDATKQNTGVAPVAATYETWKIILTTAGTATFYRNGVKVGSAMSNAITANLLVTPVVAAFSRGAASRNIDVDWVRVEQVRTL